MPADDLKTFAKGLRRRQTDAEKKLWRNLRSREFQTVKFRRQVPLEPYIADFCSFEVRLIIELDGGQHAEKAEADGKRTEFLKDSGYQILRFWNHDVLNNIDGVLETIRQHLKSPLTPPFPARGEGEKKKR